MDAIFQFLVTKAADKEMIILLGVVVIYFLNALLNNSYARKLEDYASEKMIPLNSIDIETDSDTYIYVSNEEIYELVKDNNMKIDSVLDLIKKLSKENEDG